MKVRKIHEDFNCKKKKDGIIVREVVWTSVCVCLCLFMMFIITRRMRA